MPSVTIKKITRETGRILVEFGHGVVREFQDVQHMRTCVRANNTREDLEDIALALALSRQPALGNPSVFEGKTVTIDFSNPANWGTVS